MRPAPLGPGAVLPRAAARHLLGRDFWRLFDFDHSFRLFKRVLGGPAPATGAPAPAAGGTWLITPPHTQLRLARTLPPARPPPGENPAPPGRLTPARVRR